MPQPPSFMQGISAPANSYSGRQMIWQCRLVSYTLSQHWLASEPLSIFVFRFTQGERKKQGNPGNEEDPIDIDIPSYQVQYELVLRRCSRHTQVLVQKRPQKRSQSIPFLGGERGGGIPLDPPSCCVLCML